MSKRKKRAYITNDGQGNLSTYQDPAAAAKGQKDTYTYNNTHGLLSIKDPLGITPIRNDYDANGRLIDTIDAFGNKITYNYNLPANSESVTNRNNQPTSYVYDNEGNVIKEIDALNNVTSYTYSSDGFNNKTSELLPGNSASTTYIYGDSNNPRSITEQTDPLGHSTFYTYDSQGHVLSTTDPKSNVATNTYDIHGNLSTSRSAQDQNPSTYQYDANGNLLQQTDPLGIVTAYGYDNSGNQTSVTVAMGLPEQSITTSTYDANGNRLTETKQNPLGSGNQTTTYQYDGSNRLISTLYPDGTSTGTTYDSLGHTVSTTDQKGRTTLDFYDSMGRAATIQYPDSRKSVYGYDNNGNRVSDTEYGTDGTFQQTTTDYDPLNRAVSVLYPIGLTHSLYDAQGRVTDSFDEDNNDTHSSYDQAGRKTSSIAGYSSSIAQESDYGYDANGNQTTLTVAGVLQSTTSYDSLNRATTVLYPQPSGQALVGPSITQYDGDGRKVAQIDQAGNKTQYGYDGQGRLIQVIDALTHVTHYTYDNLGNELIQQDANNHITSYTYDNMNRRKTRTLPGGQSETYNSYDATGNLTSKTTFNGKQISYSYTPLDDKLQSESFAEGSINLNYDGFLRRQSMQDASGTTTYNYDSRNRMVAKHSPFGTLTYGYDNHGNLTSTSSSNTNGTNVSYSYDQLNRPTTVTDTHGTRDLTTTYGYDPFGNLEMVNKPNGESVTYTYDVFNRLNSMAAKVSANTIASYTYTLGAAGNRTNVAELSNRAVTYTYDSLYRLTSEVISNDPVTANIGAISYQYDNVGNRTNRTSGITAISSQSPIYDAGGDDRETSDGTNSYFYDADGSTTQIGPNTYSFDSLDRMTQATVNGNTSTYVYDGDGNKVQETNNSGTNTFLVDSNNLTGYAQVLEVLQSGSVSKVYTYGSSRISQDQQLTANNWQLSFYGYDGTGSVRYLTDASGNIQNQTTFDAFGNTIYQNNTVPNVMLYDGEEQSPNTGFYDLRARWMNPGIGRFQSMDSFEGGQYDPLSLHKFTYTSNNPLNERDPSGHDGGDENISGASIEATKLLQQGVNILPLTLDDEVSDQGIIERLFISELRNPSFLSYTPQLGVQSMRLLGALIHNRVLTEGFPNSIWGVITQASIRYVKNKNTGTPYWKVSSQFQGFAFYPYLDSSVENRIQDILDKANDASASLNKQMIDFVHSIKNIAGQTTSGSINDPYNGRTLYMLTAGAGKPFPGAVELTTILGNTFYGEY